MGRHAYKQVRFCIILYLDYISVRMCIRVYMLCMHIICLYTHTCTHLISYTCMYITSIHCFISMQHL